MIENTEAYLEIGKYLAKISNRLEYNDIDLKILCQRLYENNLPERAAKSYKAMKAIQDVTLDPNYIGKAIADCLRDPSNIKEYRGLYTDEKGLKYLETIAQYRDTNKHNASYDDTKPVDYYKLTESSIDQYIANGGQFKDIELKYEKQSDVPNGDRPTVPDLHSFDEDNATEEEIAAYMDSKDKKVGCTFEEWKKTQLGIPWSWEGSEY